ncbi:alpha/beta hydrolase [Candidatus Saccharibacteria bacterium]|nr:alpha/beta hydrolase [Candidatus Saccharibacteria bacterium]
MRTIYIIHGWTYTVEPWAKTIDILKKNGIIVKMLHVPGLTEPSNKVWTIEEYVSWANQNIPDGAIALGHSNGGRILLNLCSETPNKLKHLILLDAAGVYEPSKKRDLSRKLSKLLSPLKNIKLLRKIVHKLLGASDYDHAPENMKKTLANMLDSDKKLDISKVTTPTTIVWGEADTVTPLRQAQKMHAKIPGSRLITRKTWNHAPYIMDPSGLAKVIFAIMKGIK